MVKKRTIEFSILQVKWNNFYKDEMVMPFIRNSSKLLITNFISVFLLFLNNYLLIKLLGEKNYGDYVIISVWLNLFGVLVLFGMDDHFIAVLPTYYFDPVLKRKSFQILVRAFKICVFVFIAVIGILLLLFQSSLFHPVLIKNKYFFFVLLFEGLLLAIVIAFFRGIHEFFIGQLVDKVLRPGFILFSLVIFLIIQKNIHLQTYLFMQILSYLPVLLLLFLLLKKRTEWVQGKIKLANSNYSIYTNFTFLAISLLYLLSTRLDIMFLIKYSKPEQVGYYNMALRIGDLVGYPLTAMNLVFPTLLSKEYSTDREKIYPMLKIYFIIGFCISALLLVFVSIFGSALLNVFGHHFTQSFVPLLILSCSPLLGSFSYPINGLLMICGKQRLSFISLLLSMLVTFGLSYFLVPSSGSIGAACASLAGSFTFMLFMIIAFKKLDLASKKLKLTL